MTTFSADRVGDDSQMSSRLIPIGSRVAAEMLAALLVVHLAFMLLVAPESPVLFNLVILLQGFLPPEVHPLLVIVGGSIIDGPLVVMERVAIGLLFGLIWLGFVIWLWQRGGWLVPILALAVGGWEVYWRIGSLQTVPDGFVLLQWRIFFGLLCAGVAILAGLIGLVAAVSRWRSREGP